MIFIYNDFKFNECIDIIDFVLRQQGFNTSITKQCVPAANGQPVMVNDISITGLPAVSDAFVSEYEILINKEEQSNIPSKSNLERELRYYKDLGYVGQEGSFAKLIRTTDERDSVEKALEILRGVYKENNLEYDIKYFDMGDFLQDAPRDIVDRYYKRPVEECGVKECESNRQYVITIEPYNIKCLDNDYMSPFFYEDKMYYNVTSALESFRCAAYSIPNLSKLPAKDSLEITSNLDSPLRWKDKEEELYLDLWRTKFLQNPKYKEILLSSSDYDLDNICSLLKELKREFEPLDFSDAVLDDDSIDRILGIKTLNSF